MTIGLSGLGLVRGTGQETSGHGGTGPANEDRRRRGKPWHLAPLGLVLGMVGCPKPEAQFEQFLDNTQEAREDGGAGMDLGGTLADISGTHLLAIAPVFSPSTPLLFRAEAMLTFAGEAGMLDLILQPLHSEDRQPVGDPIELLGIPVDGSGAFTVDSGEITVDGMANPISGANIVGDLTLTGSIQDSDLFCGGVSGMLSQPIMFDLVGSTFAAIRIEAGASGDALPMEFPSACPAGGENGGSSTGDPTTSTTSTRTSTTATSTATTAATTTTSSSSGPTTGTTGTTGV